MKARPISVAVANALAQLVLERARDHLRICRDQISVPDATYMRVASEDIAATLLGAVCGTEPELELRRLLGDGRRHSASFGPAMRNEAEHQALAARTTRGQSRLRAARAPRRFIDHTHPQD